ncbi:MAG: hypothetical protein CXT70_01905 [Methanobacteriota archaeon]|nr:MAG: hypothetical protein CXT70_01905 [Euryarchaeota archaeon]
MRANEFLHNTRCCLTIEEVAAYFSGEGNIKSLFPICRKCFSANSKSSFFTTSNPFVGDDSLNPPCKALDDVAVRAISFQVQKQ